jgi:hypothetical protein
VGWAGRQTGWARTPAVPGACTCRSRLGLALGTDCYGRPAPCTMRGMLYGMLLLEAAVSCASGRTRDL